MDGSCTSGGRANQIATGANLLDIMHESYGYSVDLIEAID